MAERTDKIIRKMGRYTLVDKLGQGSMGVVYKAYDEMLDRYVALKTMVSDMTTDTELRKRFYQEARLAAKINHPYIITVFDLGEVEGQIYIAMELLEGEDLKSFLKEGKTLSMEQKVDWMIQLAEAFSFAHDEGIIHRDIKPGNIHIRANGDLVVMDFGIARAASSDITRAGAIIGTPEYISPEQILAIKVDHRADIFSLGLVFYEILTRTHPFRSVNLPATIHRVLNEHPIPPKEIDPTIPVRLNDLVMKAMAKDVADRFQNCKEILQELLNCREEFSRQARSLVNARDILNNETITYITRLQDLYPRREFLAICEELNYDPSTGHLSDPSMPKEPTYTQASEFYAKSHHRMVRAKHYIEGSAQIESIMQAAKALYAAGEYQKCIEQMNIILAYSPGHELSAEYIQQCQHRIREQEELQKRRRYIIQAEQEIMNFFQAGDITNCQRGVLTLLGIDPENGIANSYLKKCEERRNLEEKASERKREIESYLAKAQELFDKKHFEECGELLNQCETIEPRNPAVRALRVRYQNALRAVERREKQENEFLETMNRAITLRTKGELDKSLNLFLDARKLRPDSQDLAREIQATEQEIRAGEEYREKLGRPRPIPKWIYAVGLALILGIALYFWMSSARRDNEARMVLATANEQIQQGDLEGSLKTLEEYTAKDPTNPEVESLLQTVKTRIAEKQAATRKDQVTKLLNDAQREEQQNNYQKAIEHYEAILKIDPLHEQAQNGLTNARVQLANTTSREKLQEEIEQAYSRARKDFADGNYAKAKIELARILTLDPENSKAQILLVNIEKKLEGPAEPPETSTKADSLVASARNEIRKKNYDRARTILDELAKLDPAHPQLGPMRKTIEQETAGPKYGSITINCEPFGNAFIDGQPIGETPIPLRKILVGQHVITVRRPGFKEVSKTINVQENAVQHLQFVLEKE